MINSARQIRGLWPWISKFEMLILRLLAWLCYDRNASSDQHQYMARKYGPFDMDDIQINES